MFPTFHKILVKGKEMYKKNLSVQINEVDGQGLIQTEDGSLHILNSTALAIHEICNNITLHDLINFMINKFPDVDTETLKLHISELLEKMIEIGLIIKE